MGEQTQPSNPDLKDISASFTTFFSIEDSVTKLAELSFKSGLDGCVCSPMELKTLRLTYDNNFQLITPGIRLEEKNLHDQKRVMTPHKAILSGASKLVIGRSITQSENPNRVFLDICRSLT